MAKNVASLVATESVTVSYAIFIAGFSPDLLITIVAIQPNLIKIYPKNAIFYAIILLKYVNFS